MPDQTPSSDLHQINPFHSHVASDQHFIRETEGGQTPPLLPSDLVLSPGSDISHNPAGARLAFQTEGLNRMSRQPRAEQQAEGSGHHLQKEQWEMAASDWNKSRSRSVGGSELRSFRRCFSLKLSSSSLLLCSTTCFCEHVSLAGTMIIHTGVT